MGIPFISSARKRCLAHLCLPRAYLSLFSARRAVPPLPSPPHRRLTLVVVSSGCLICLALTQHGPHSTEAVMDDDMIVPLPVNDKKQLVAKAQRIEKRADKLKAKA